MPESRSAAQLAAAHAQLLQVDGRVDLESDGGVRACKAFLDILAEALRGLRVKPVSRPYRTHFTKNYRALFPDEAPRYRVDMLEMCLGCQSPFWVNGAECELGREAQMRGEALEEAWEALGRLLSVWPAAQGASLLGLAAAMAALDRAWAKFEESCIGELMAIERQARGCLAEAAEEDQELRRLEASGAGASPEFIMQRRRLANSVARLNATANTARKGRGDLSADVLDGADAALRARRGSNCKDHPEEADVAECLATRVLDSFASLRDYLHEAAGCLDHVDPQLSRNPGLVARLADWEESWELGARYVQQPALLHAVCRVVTRAKALQRSVPAFADACETCNVELFLSLPRLVWLCFLVEPSSCAELLRLLLPHRFGPDQPAAGPQLRELCGRFTQLAARLGKGAAKGPEEAAWEVLAAAAIMGSSEAAESEQQTVQAFMRDLEGWSMELQRHCPEDWNRCSAVLMQCLLGQPLRARRPSKFQV